MLESTLIKEKLGPTIDDCDELSRLLGNAWSGSYNVDKISSKLKYFGTFLCNPLRQPGPNDQNRKDMANGNKINLPGLSIPIQLPTNNNETFNWISSFSDATQLNENIILALLHSSQNMLNKYKESGKEIYTKLEDCVLMKYFGSRNKKLKILNEIIVIYINSVTNPTRMPQLNNILSDFIKKLFENNLIKNLCGNIVNILNIKDKTYWKQFEQEIVDIVGIFYSITNRIQLNVNQIKYLFQVFDKIVFDKSYHQHSKLIKASYIISLTLFPALLYNEITPVYVFIFYIKIYLLVQGFIYYIRTYIHTELTPKITVN